MPPLQDLEDATELGLAAEVLDHRTQPGDQVSGYLAGALFLPRGKS